MNANPAPRPLSNPGDPMDRDPTRTGYAPSAVPMPVHRQVVAELDSATQQIQTLISENQALQQQNQDLKTEIERVVKAVRRLQGLAEGSPNYNSSGSAPWEEVPENDRTVPYYESPSPKSNYGSIVRDTRLQLSPEAPDVDDAELNTTLQRSEHRSDLGGWWMMLTILLIVVTAFGTGFLIVRPFLSNPEPVPDSTSPSLPQ